MNALPFRLVRALFRAARDLPPRGNSGKTTEALGNRNEPPRVSLFLGIMEAVPPAHPGPEAAEATAVRRD